MKNQTKKILRISVALAFFLLGMLIGNGTVRLALFLLAYACAGYDIILKAFRNIIRGNAMDENFLMTVATVGAFVLSEFAEGVAVMVFYQIGELFNAIAVDRSRRNISSVMALRPNFARLVLPDGTEQEVDPYDVKQGDVILVRVGERVPLDGELISGRCVLDTSALTGESLPREETGIVCSGCINLESVIRLKVIGDFETSTVSKILDLVESASNKKAKAENFITKFARYYTPIVVFLALAVAILPSLITGQWQLWLQRALVFLVVSCPCALVISVPLTFFSGLGALAKSGIMVKGSNYIDILSQIKTVAMDKTGTLTKGKFEITEIKGITVSDDELLRLAATAEYHSSHPIARCIVNACPDVTVPEVENELAGGGTCCKINGKTVAVGSAALAKQFGVEVTEQAGRVFVCCDGTLAGYITVADTLKEDSVEAVRALNKMGIDAVMLTGDTKASAKEIARQAGISRYRYALMPGDKVVAIEELIKDGKTAFVGDGINDAPVLARADVGIAMGQLGSDAAIEAADIIIMNDSLVKISTAIRLAKRIMLICKQNIVFSLVVKIAVLMMGVFGIANMWIAVFADVGVSVLAVLNAMRAMRLGASQKNNKK